MNYRRVLLLIDLEAGAGAAASVEIRVEPDLDAVDLGAPARRYSPFEQRTRACDTAGSLPTAAAVLSDVLWSAQATPALSNAAA